MSHDIRTPMNAIIGFVGIAASHIDNKERVQDCLEKILSSSNHLLSLINDILDMSRIESGKISLQEKECNLSECIHIPIIAMTANAFEEDKKNAYKAGMNGHIAKPINVNELISTLLEVLGREKSQV